MPTTPKSLANYFKMSAPKYKHSFRYAVDTLTGEETVLGKWPDLAVHSALVEHGFGEDDVFLRYAVLLGEGSGLHRVITDFGERKREALRLAGVAETHPRYNGAFDLTDPGVQVLRWTWLKLFSSRKFRAYIATCAAYDQNCMKVEAMIVPHEKEGDASQLDDEQQNIIALLKGKGKGNDSGLKADAEQRAYKLRNDLIKELAPQDALLSDMEMQLFFGDEELKQMAHEKAAAEGGTSWESLVMKGK